MVPYIHFKKTLFVVEAGEMVDADDMDQDDDSQHPQVPIEQLRPEIQRHYMLNKDVNNIDNLHDKDASETVSRSNHGPYHLFPVLRKRI